MKKIVTIATIFLMVVMFATTIVSAATKDSLVNDLYALTSKYGVTEADKVKAERFLTEYPITEDQVNQIYGKATEAIKILEDTMNMHSDEDVRETARSVRALISYS